MAVNKLNIEFEDDEEIQAREEAKRKSSEALKDVDLSFSADDDSGSAKEKSPATSKGRAKPDQPKRQAPGQPVRSQERATPREAAPQNSGGYDFQQIPTRQVYVGPDYKLGDELKKIAASNQILGIEIEARVKVEVTQQISQMIAEHHAKNKLLEHKINKLLGIISQKAPSAKAELMTIKKLLREQASLTGSEEANPPQQNAAKKKVAPSRVPPKKKVA